MKNKEGKATEFTTYFEIEMEVKSFTLNGKPSKSEELDAAINHQLRFVSELLETLSLLSGFAVTSLLTPDDELNEYSFDHIKLFESFKFLTDFASKIVKNANVQLKTEVLKF